MVLSLPTSCPVCHKPGTLLYSGTTDPEQFFRQKSTYAIAASDRQQLLPIYRCTTCGHGYTPITFDPHSIVEWYQATSPDRAFLAEEAGRRHTAQKVLKKIKELVGRPHNLLDVGAGPGFFASEAQAAGWQVAGVEPAQWAVAYAQNTLGVAGITQGDVADVRSLPAASRQVVTAFDVIEHLVNPGQFLRDVARVLQPDGVLVLTMPRFDSVVARLMGAGWYCIMPAHLHYFSLPSLMVATSAAGLQLAATYAHTRYLSSTYLWHRLREYVRGTSLPSNQSGTGILVPVNFRDEFEVYVRKAKH